MPSRNNYAAKRQRPVIRVFVSSTFSDLKLERDALARRVFPKLEQLCQTEGFQFQAIDLRWGVSTEATLDHRTMRICFEELRRSQEVSPQPNFLILLGDRYGWRPLPEEISQSEFADLVAATLPDSDGNTIDGTGDKTAEDVLKEWYRLDTNAVPPVHVLRPRTDSPDGQDYTQVKDAKGNLVQDASGNNQETPAWAAVQKVLWEIIDRAFPVSELASRFDSLSTADPSQPSKPIRSIIRFQASATEQEIWAGALTVPDAEQHVLAFFRDITRCDIPVGRIANPSHVKAYFNLDGNTIDATAHDAQTALKQRINDELGNKAVRFEANLTVAKDASGQPTTTVSADHLDDLCRQVESQLTAIIDRQIKEYWDPQASEKQKSALSQAELAARDLEIERDEHLRLADEHTAHFVGREEEAGPLERIQAYLDDPSRLPLLIHGDSGCGKTALLARAFKLAAPESNPIIRFIGVTPRSSDIRSLLSNLCLELRQLETASDPLEGRTPEEGLTPFQTQPLPTDIHELQQEFRQHLQSASEQQRPVVLFLDALDQLSEADGGLHLSWLPGRSSDPLPAGVKIIVSCLSDRHDDDPAGRPFAMLRDVLPEDHVIELDALPLRDAKHLLDHWLSDAGRTIGDQNANQQNQRSLINERLASDKQCRQPLFLKLLFEEVKLWRSYDKNCCLQKPEQRDRDTTTDEAVSPLRSNPHIDALLRQLFDRLSDSTNHGKLLVERALGYLAAARRGLSEIEILEVLFSDPDYKTHLDAESKRTNHTIPSDPSRIPIAIWSRLRSDLDPYLTERAAPGGNVLTFYHRQIAEWIEARFVDKAAWNPHVRLADFFGKQNFFLASVEHQRAQADQLPVNRGPNTLGGTIGSFICAMLVFRLVYGDWPPFKGDMWQWLSSDSQARWALGAALVGIIIGAVIGQAVGAVIDSALKTIRRRPGEFSRPFNSLSRRPPARIQTDQNIANIRQLDELPWHLSKAEEWTRLAELLADPTFFTLAWEFSEEEIKRYWSRLQTAVPDVELRRVYSGPLTRPNDFDDGFLGRLASLFSDTGHLDEALSLRRFLVEHAAARTRDPAERARALSNEAEVLRMRGDIENAYPRQLQAEQIFRQTGQPIALGRCLLHLGLMNSIRGQANAAVRHYVEAEKLFHSCGYLRGLVRCKRNRAELLREQGNFSGALELSQECEELLTTGFTDNPTLARILGLKASVYLQRGDLDQADETLVEAEAIFRELGDRDGLANVFAAQAGVMWERATRSHSDKDGFMLDEVLRLQRDEEEIWREVDDHIGLARCLVSQVKVFEVRGQFDEAMSLCKEAEKFGRQTGDQFVMQIIAQNVSRIHENRGY